MNEKITKVKLHDGNVINLNQINQKEKQELYEDLSESESSREIPPKVSLIENVRKNNKIFNELQNIDTHKSERKQKPEVKNHMYQNLKLKNLLLKTL